MLASTRALAWSAALLPAAVLALTSPATARSVEPGDDTVSVTAAPSPSHAVTRSMAVSYHDLDLATVRGQRRLDRRVDDAAAAVCDDIGGWDRFAWQDKRRCLDNAVTTAMAQVHGTAGAGAQ